MEKLDLYKKYGMNEYFEGDSFEIKNENSFILSKQNSITIIDQICESEKRNQLYDKWQQINLENCFELILNAFNFDLAYTGCEIMPKEKALFFRELIFNKLNINECLCFTNWFENPWTSKKGAGWNPITENTFDMAVVLVDSKKTIFTYFISED